MEIGCCDNLLGMHKDVFAKYCLAGLEGAVVLCVGSGERIELS